MKLKTILTLGWMFVLSACVNPVKEKELFDKFGKLEIPDKVEVKRNNKEYYQFSGTRVFIDKPERFEKNSIDGKIKKGDANYMLAFENKQISFSEHMRNTKMHLSTLPSQNVYYQKEFKLGNYDAFFVEGAGETQGYDQIMLLFGDRSFSVMLLGEYRRGIEITRQEIYQAFLSAYVDKSVKPDYSEFEIFDIDLSSTDFKFKDYMAQTFFYSVEGGDIMNNMFTDLLMISIHPNAYGDERKKLLNDVLLGYQNSGLILEQLEDNEIDLNGRHAYQTITKGKISGRDMYVYQLAIGYKSSVVVLCGVSYDENHKKQIETVAKTMKFK